MYIYKRICLRNSKNIYMRVTNKMRIIMYIVVCVFHSYSFIHIFIEGYRSAIY